MAQRDNLPFHSIEGEQTILRTGKTKIEGRLPFSPGVLLDSINSFTGKSLASESGAKLDVCPLEQLCLGIERKNMPKDLQDRKLFAKIGQWTDLSGVFTVGLALTAGSEDPWKPLDYVAHHLVAFLILNGQAIYPHDNKWTTRVEVFVSEPESDARRLGLIRERHDLDGELRSLSQHPRMIALDLKTFTNRLVRYHSVWQFSQCDAIFEISWSQSVTRKPDVSGLLQVFKVPELTLSIAEHLDLRTIESLRQSCQYFRNMEPLAAIGTKRMQRTLRRAFGCQRTEEQTDKLIKEFNALLCTTGGIIGGSTALSVMCPGNWLPADTDIVVGEKYAVAMQAFLVDRVGLVFNPQKSQLAESFYPGEIKAQDPASYRDHIRFTYYRFDHPIPDQPGVDFIIIHPRSIAAPADWVLTYHSTVVMNFWTGRTLHSLWPDLTVNGKYLRNEYTPTPRIETALRKYRMRGFTDVHKNLWNDEHRYLQDDYPNTKCQRLTIDVIPGPTWRKELALV